MTAMRNVLRHYGLMSDWQSDFEHVMVICPFHNDTQASMSIHLDTGQFMCFGCHASGSLVDFVRRIEGVTGIAALITAQQIAGPALYQRTVMTPTEPRSVLREDAFDFFDSLPQPEWGALTNEYLLDDREFDPLTLTAFDVRLNPTSNYSVLWPIYEQGVFMGYQSRRADDKEPKYLFSKGFSKHHVLAGDIKPGDVFLTEGWLDLMRAWEFGMRNLATPMNWHASQVQLEKIAAIAHRVICAFDNDTKGEQGYRRLEDALEQPVIRFQFPVGILDLCEFVRRQDFETAMRQTGLEI